VLPAVEEVALQVLPLVRVVRQVLARAVLWQDET
jgi:hypothetical protein